ncbi:MAG: hypothetical protein COB02_18445 [Candidatus Cloacimonadota bacterium]|nr:MAG: hypothetical protein COB02_18445 [Candidatus Cloacimonadota bacterium]
MSEVSFQIFSDLHLEFHKDGGSSFLESLLVSAPYVILAGDICSVKQMIEVYNEFSKKYKEVYFLLGNHEFYGSSFSKVFKEAQKVEKKFKNVHWLNRTTFTIEKQRILGCSLWFRDQWDNKLYQQSLSDFSYIESFANYVYKENQKDISFLKTEVKEGDIVVTHHLPSHQSVSEQFKHSPLTRFFLCYMSDVIDEKKPSIWIHGHTHDSFDYLESSTRVICNPFGYPREAKPKFNETCVISV